MATRFTRYCSFGLALFCSNAALAQVYKCNVNGVTIYQQRSCSETGAIGNELVIRGSGQRSSSNTDLKPLDNQSRASDNTAPKPSDEPKAPVQPIMNASKSPFEIQADQCLEWYRPFLRDPRGAYLKDPRKDGRVVTIAVHATNGYGGYVTKEASCEFKSGQMDADWNKIHAKRLGWNVP